MEIASVIFLSRPHACTSSTTRPLSKGPSPITIRSSSYVRFLSAHRRTSPKELNILSVACLALTQAFPLLFLTSVFVAAALQELNQITHN